MSHTRLSAVAAGPRQGVRTVISRLQPQLLSAALRHLRDSEHLASEAGGFSLDQAYHLAGFAPECARKATIPRSTFHRAIGHGFGASSEVALEAALALDPVARRYRLTGWASDFPTLAGWSEQARYEPTGTRKPEEVASLLDESRRIVGRIAATLWADGMIPGDFTW